MGFIPLVFGNGIALKPEEFLSRLQHPTISWIFDTQAIKQRFKARKQMDSTHRRTSSQSQHFGEVFSECHHQGYTKEEIKLFRSLKTDKMIDGVNCQQHEDSGKEKEDEGDEGSESAIAKLQTRITLLTLGGDSNKTRKSNKSNKSSKSKKKQRTK